MFLVSDIGNTQTVIGIYESKLQCTTKPKDINDANPLISWRIATNKHDAPGDLEVKLCSLLKNADIAIGAIEAVVFASVVPALSISWRVAVQDIFGIEPIQCNYELAKKRGLFDSDYPNPEEIGADRIADTVAVKCLYGGPAIVVDFGTATNFEIIDSKGRFSGGIIAPGIMTGANALFSNATRLAATELCAPAHSVGKSTEEALQSGIVLGEVARVDGLLSMALAEIGSVSESDGGDCKIIATGGLASLVADYSSVITDVSPYLTLIGLAFLV